MKKIVLLIAALMMMCIGCAAPSSMDTVDDVEHGDSLVVVDKIDNYTIVMHKETGVHYLSKYAAGGGLGLCVMVNADGTPYTGR